MLSYLLVLQLLLLQRKFSLAWLRVLLLLFKKQRLGALPRAPFHLLCLLQYAELAGFKLQEKVGLGAKQQCNPLTSARPESAIMKLLLFY